MAKQLASDSSESKFDEEFSDQESPDYTDSQNHYVKGAARPYMYEPEVEMASWEWWGCLSVKGN